MSNGAVIGCKGKEEGKGRKEKGKWGRAKKIHIYPENPMNNPIYLIPETYTAIKIYFSLDTHLFGKHKH
jgi:hypothetical protein